MEQRRNEPRRQAAQRRSPMPAASQGGKPAPGREKTLSATHRGRAGGAAQRRESPRPSGATGVVGGGLSGARSGPAALLARVPRPRLTALGGGFLAVVVMLVVGTLTALLFDGSTTVYGVCFLLVCLACALWVRVIDALSPPVVVPIAFAVGLAPIGGDEGVGAWFVELATTLAVNAGWLYGGTAITVLLVVVRRSVYAARRRRDRQRPARA